MCKSSCSRSFSVSFNTSMLASVPVPLNVSSIVTERETAIQEPVIGSIRVECSSCSTGVPAGARRPANWPPHYSQKFLGIASPIPSSSPVLSKNPCSPANFGDLEVGTVSIRRCRFPHRRESPQQEVRSSFWLSGFLFCAFRLSNNAHIIGSCCLADARHDCRERANDNSKSMGCCLVEARSTSSSTNSQGGHVRTTVPSVTFS